MNVSHLHVCHPLQTTSKHVTLTILGFLIGEGCELFLAIVPHTTQKHKKKSERFKIVLKFRKAQSMFHSVNCQ